MLNIKASFANHDSNIFFTTYFQGKSNFVILATYSSLKSEIYDQANSFIINEVLTQDFENSSREALDGQLKEFFVELNWKLYAQFRKSNLPEQGMSLLLAVVLDNDVYIVQFGRMLCCSITGKKMQELGRSWENFHVKTKSELFLLGSIEDNIHVKVQAITMKPGTYFIALPSSHTEQFSRQFDQVSHTLSMLSKLYSESPFPYFMIGADFKRSEKRKSFFKRRKFRITAVIAMILIALAIWYVKTGNNCVQEYINRSRLMFKHKTRIQITDVLDSANPQIEKQIKQIERVAMSPARSITLKSELVGDMTYPITAPPQWDINHIYLSSHNRLIAIDKHSHAQQWEKTFDNEVLKVSKTEDKSLLVMEKDNQVMLIHSDGKEIWNNNAVLFKQALDEPTKFDTPYEITFQEDARLNGSILVFQTDTMIYIVNSLTGETISQYRFSDPISFISTYDPLEHCFYVVINRSLVKLTLEIKSW